MNVKSRAVLLFSSNANCKHLNTSSMDNPGAELRNGRANEMKLKGGGKKHCDSYCTVHGSSLESNAVSHHNTLLSYRN